MMRSHNRSFEKDRGASSIERLQNCGTALFFVTLAVVLLHVIALLAVMHQEHLALEAGELIVEQQNDLQRVGRNVQSIMMLRQETANRESLIEANHALIAELRDRIKARDREIDRHITALDVPFFRTEAVLKDRLAYAQIIDGFLDRAARLGTDSNDPLATTWTLPDLAIAPHGRLLTSLARLENTFRAVVKRLVEIEFYLTAASALAVVLIVAVLVFRYFRPLALRARDDYLQLQSSLEIRTRYFYQMSHELRTPLNAINGYAELIKMRAQSASDTNIERHAEFVLSAAGQLTHRVEDILTLAEIQAGTYENRIGEIDPGPVVRGIVQKMQTDACSLDVVDNRRTPDRVACDSEDLETILTHLLRNACRHARSRCVVRLLQDGTDTVIETVDDGQGLDSAVTARVMNAFHTTSNAIMETDSGLGLGLCLVNMLAGINNIGFSIAAGPEGGTVARLTFRIVDPDSAARTVQSTSPVPLAAVGETAA